MTPPGQPDAHGSSLTSSPTAASNARHARIIVQQLLAQGVRDAVISPGSRNTPLVFAFDAAARQAMLQVHVVLDERVAGFMALGLARRSGRPVALSCTSGSAGAHYLPAIMEAAHAGICLIALTADRPDELQRRGAPQTTDQLSFFGAHVHEILSLPAPLTHSANDAPFDHHAATSHAVERAIAGARAARKPLHINPSFREPLWHADCQAMIDAPYAAATPTIFAPTLHPSRDGLNALSTMSGRGLIVVGPIDAGVLSTAEAEQFRAGLQRVSQRLDWPVAADAVSLVRQRNLATIKHLDILLRDDSIFTQESLDHVVVVGPWPTSKAFGLWLGRNPRIQVTSLPGHLDALAPWHRVTQSVRGDLLACLEAVGASIADDKGTTNIDAARAGDRAVDETIATFCAEHPHFEGSIAREVVHAASAPLTLHIASSMPIRDVDAYAEGVADGVTLCSSRGINGIDGNISTALGESLAAKEPALLLMGDLAFRHDVGGLMHAANIDVSLTIVVIDNEGGGIFRHLAVSKSGDAFSPYFLTPQRTSITALAKSCGARVQTLADALSLRDALINCMHSPGVDVLVVRTDSNAQVPWRNAAVSAALQTARAHSWGAGAASTDLALGTAEEAQ